MFDLLKNKLSSFTKKIQEQLSQKQSEKKDSQVAEPDYGTQSPALSAQEQKLEEKEAPKQTKKTARPLEEKRELKAKIRATEKIKAVFTREIEVKETDLEPFLEELELALLEADVEQQTAMHICSEIKKEIAGKKFSTQKNIHEQIKEHVKQALLETMNTPQINLAQNIREKKPFKILFLGPNGAGKTTTIAKIVHYLQKNGLSSILCAGDTFRAASIEQIKVHAQNLNTRVVSHSYGADPTAVAFDCVKAAEAKKIDAVLIDTAGRQETNKNLVQELKKIERVIKPDLKIFIAESTSGQALLSQAKEFDAQIGIDAFILTKIDADTKGGSAISLLYNLKKPVIFIGTGQKYTDLQEFSPQQIIDKIV